MAGSLTKEIHLHGDSGKKRILALDGGGVRGILTLHYLKRIETLLRKRHDDPSLLLSDYFDLIGGTSTGAIIAAGLALGFPVDKVISLYEEVAVAIFKREWYRWGVLVPKFGTASLEASLRKAYNAPESADDDTRMGSDRIRTGLMIMTKRMDTGSPWPLSNNDRDRYWRLTREFPLWKLVRASTAAPHFFKPETVVVENRARTETTDGQFVDGGVSTANNPSLQLLHLVGLTGHGLNWTFAPDRLLLVSVGTGLASRKHGRASGFRLTAGGFAAKAILSLMDDCNDLVELQCQWMSKTATPWKMDSVTGDMQRDSLPGGPLFTYLRYNVKLEEKWMRETFGEPSFSQRKLTRLSQMDRPENMRGLSVIGKVAAARQVDPEHFADF